MRPHPHSRSWWALVLLAGCTGEITVAQRQGAGGGSSATCVEDGPGSTPLRRLSTQQYQNTVHELLTASGLSALNPTLQPLLDAVPADSTLAFTGLDNRLSGLHLNAWFNVAVAVGDAVEQTAAYRVALAGTCANAPTLTEACLDTFFNGFARRALRRPLTQDERTSLSALNDGVRPPAEALRAMVVTLLLEPAFLNQLELDGTPQGGVSTAPLELTPFELASRLSYTFWQSPPDDALLNAAADGSLVTDTGYHQQLQRVFADPRTASTLWRFWREWLRLDAFSGFATGRPGFQALTAGLAFGQPGHDPYRDMVQEVHDLTEWVTFTQPSSLETLLSTNVSLTKSSDLAQIYGVAAWNGQGAPPRFLDGSRAGLLQRAALLVSNQEQTNPFHRGALLRKTLLCDALQAPDPNSLPPGSLDPPLPSATDSTRQRFAKKVDGNGLCIGCHGAFSDLGYIQEQYDAIGRFRTVEKAFDEQTGALLASLPINATGVPRVSSGDDRAVTGVAELNQRLIESGRVATCLARNYLAFAQRRVRTTGGDACTEARFADRLRGSATLAEVFKAIADEPSFRLHVVGTP